MYLKNEVLFITAILYDKFLPITLFD